MEDHDQDPTIPLNHERKKHEVNNKDSQLGGFSLSRQQKEDGGMKRRSSSLFLHGGGFKAEQGMNWERTVDSLESHDSDAKDLDQKREESRLSERTQG